MVDRLNHKGSVPIHCQRIILQPFKVSDAFFMFRNWANDPDVTRYMTWFPHENMQVTESVISSWVNDYSKPNFYQWAILLKKIDEPIGSIGVVELDAENQSCEIGYCIGKAYWHQGYTTEALRAVLDFLFKQVGIKTIIARHDIRNPHSGDVMRKSGMKYVETRENIGLTKEGEPLNCAYYSIELGSYLKSTCEVVINENV